MDARPLPAEVEQLSEEIRALSPNIAIAYRKILKLEGSSDEKTKSSDGEEKSNHEKNLMYARILGYLLIHGPSDKARKTVADEVVSCKNDDQLAGHGKHYLDYYIRPFQKLRACTPAASSYSSGLDEVKSTISLTESPKSHVSAKQRALVRDGHRCPVTGNYERSAAIRNPKVEEEAIAAGARIISTRCAHIFDSSINSNLGNEGIDKHDYATSVWGVMKLFGYNNILDNLNGENIHRLDNILTLDGSIYYFFNRLEIWFEATDERDKYRLGAIRPGFIYKFKQPVKFTTPDPIKYPLPSPLYLHIHATCGKITHLSGAGKYINKILMDLEDIKVLSNDGTSADLLEYLLLPWSHEPLSC